MGENLFKMVGVACIAVLVGMILKYGGQKPKDRVVLQFIDDGPLQIAPDDMWYLSKDTSITRVVVMGTDTIYPTTHYIVKYY